MVRAIRLRWSRPVAVLALAIATGLVLAGCGAVTHHDWVVRADAICTATTREERSLRPPSFVGGATAERRAFGAYLARVAAILGAQDGRLRALPRPSERHGQAAQRAAYLRAVEVTVDDVRRMAAAAAAGRSAALSAAETRLAADPVQARATAYGLTACAGPAATIGPDR